MVTFLQECRQHWMFGYCKKIPCNSLPERGRKGPGKSVLEQIRLYDEHFAVSRPIAPVFYDPLYCSAYILKIFWRCCGMERKNIISSLRHCAKWKSEQTNNAGRKNEMSGWSEKYNYFKLNINVNEEDWE